MPSKWFFVNWDFWVPRSSTGGCIHILFLTNLGKLPSNTCSEFHNFGWNLLVPDFQDPKICRIIPGNVSIHKEISTEFFHFQKNPVMVLTWSLLSNSFPPNWNPPPIKTLVECFGTCLEMFFFFFLRGSYRHLPWQMVPVKRSKSSGIGGVGNCPCLC